MKKADTSALLAGVLGLIQPGRASQDVSLKVTSDELSYRAAPNAVASFTWVPIEGNSFSYPFDTYRFAFDVQVASFLEADELKKVGMPPRDTKVPSLDLGETLRRVYKETIDPLVDREELERVRGGYRNLVMPTEVEIQLPSRYVFADVAIVDSHLGEPLSGFRIARKRGVGFVTVAVLLLAAILAAWIALAADVQSVNLQSLGYFAALLAIRAFLLNDAETSPTLLDYFVTVILCAFLIAFLWRSGAKRPVQR